MGAASPGYRFAMNPPWGELPRINAVVGSRLAGDYHVPAYETPLTLKSVPQGVLTYATPRTRYRMDARSVVVLNAGQTYSLDIDADDRAATLAVFFEPGFVEAVARAVRGGERAMLEPAGDEAGTFGACERLHAKEGALAACLAALRERMLARTASEAWIEARLFELAREVVLLDARDRDAMRAMPGLRAATREEAYRRLHWARDFLDGSIAEPLTVASLARVACMSPYHFHHLFRRAFGETPMQRVQRLRLAAAAELLATTDRSVTCVCADVGFESLGSFSALFRRRYGETPRAYRQKRRIGEVRPGGAP
jgi:AraC-like DNA-binding protein